MESSFCAHWSRLGVESGRTSVSPRRPGSDGWCASHRSISGCRLRATGRGHPATRGPSLRCRAWHSGRRRGTRTARRARRPSTIHSGTGRPRAHPGWRASNHPTGWGWSAPAARWRGVAILPSPAGRVVRLAGDQPAPPSSGTDRYRAPGLRVPGRTSRPSCPSPRRTARRPPRTRTARGTRGTCHCAARCSPRHTSRCGRQPIR